MENKTLELAKQELRKYGMTAELVLEKSLPSFEIRCKNGTAVITAPDPFELLYGVYDLAERAGGCCFFEPGRDRFDPARVRTLSPELKEYAQIRGIVIESGHHNFNYWIPGRKYGKTHPEFFAEINGKRIQSSDGKSELLLDALRNGTEWIHFNLDWEDGYIRRHDQVLG